MSDQDFFFDDDEKPAGEGAGKPSASAKSAPSASRPSRPAASAAPGTAQSVTVTVGALIGVISLLVGIIIGILIPAGGSTVSTPTVSPGAATAPQLSPEQLDSGALPEGHPDVGAMGGETGADPGADPSAEDTAAGGE